MEIKIQGLDAVAQACRPSYSTWEAKIRKIAV
jgi:hypothetical protein